MQDEARGQDRAAESLDRALDLVRFLRANCAWDAAQTPRSLLPYLLEEAHEVADAVAAGDEQALPSELGDLLLNVAFQVVLAEERAAFGAEAVVRALEAKMRRRHPHLYGDGPAEDWETLKQRERRPADTGRTASVLEGIPRGLEPLARAYRIQERVSAVGFDWPSPAGALAKVEEELTEVRAELSEDPPDARGGNPALEAELGDLLFAVVNLARLAGVHALGALQGANARFASRFEALERLASERGLVLGEASLEQLDGLWDEIKRRRKDGGSYG